MLVVRLSAIVVPEDIPVLLKEAGLKGGRYRLDQRLTAPRTVRNHKL
jgi:hypothetical protein